MIGKNCIHIVKIAYTFITGLYDTYKIALLLLKEDENL